MASSLKGDRISIPNSSSNPSSGVKGDVYLDTGENLLYFNNGTAWAKVSATIVLITSISGNVIAGSGGVINFTGSGFLNNTCTINFISGSTTASVTASASSDGVLSNVSVPASIYNLNTGTTVMRSQY